MLDLIPFVCEKATSYQVAVTKVILNYFFAVSFSDRIMTSLVNEGNAILVVLGDKVSQNDTVNFIAAIKERIGDLGELSTTSLSSLKEGKRFFIQFTIVAVLQNICNYVEL